MSRGKMPPGVVYALIGGRWSDVYVAGRLDDRDYHDLNIWWGNRASAFAYNNKDITMMVRNA